MMNSDKQYEMEMKILQQDLSEEDRQFMRENADTAEFQEVLEKVMSVEEEMAEPPRHLDHMILQHAAEVHKTAKAAYFRLAVTAAATFAIVCLTMWMLPTPINQPTTIVHNHRSPQPAPKHVSTPVSVQSPEFAQPAMEQPIAKQAETKVKMEAEVDELFDAFYNEETELVVFETELLLDELNTGDAQLVEDLL